MVFRISVSEKKDPYRRKKKKKKMKKRMKKRRRTSLSSREGGERNMPPGGVSHTPRTHSFQTARASRIYMPAMYTA